MRIITTLIALLFSSITVASDITAACRSIEGEFSYAFAGIKFKLKDTQNSVYYYVREKDVPKEVLSIYDEFHSDGTTIKGNYEICTGEKWWGNKTAIITSATIKTSTAGFADCAHLEISTDCYNFNLNHQLQLASNNLVNEKSRQYLLEAQNKWNDWVISQCRYESQPFINGGAMDIFSSCQIRLIEERMVYLKNIGPCNSNACP